MGLIRTVRGAAALATAAAATVALVGCGPPSETPSAAPTTSPPTTAAPGPVGPAGEPVPDALAGFSCGPDDAGTWVATGTLTNSSADRADFVVTVLVAGPTSTSAQAKRQVLTLAGGESKPVELTSLPVPVEGELSCQAQVVRRS